MAMLTGGLTLPNVTMKRMRKAISLAKAMSSRASGVKAKVAMARFTPGQICTKPNSTRVPVMAPNAKFTANTAVIRRAAL